MECNLIVKSVIEAIHGIFMFMFLMSHRYLLVKRRRLQ